MKRLVERSLAVAAFVGVLVGAGCGMLEDDVRSWRSERTATLVGTVASCSSMQDVLRGLEVYVFRLQGGGGLLALQAHGDVLCIDDVITIRNTGIVPIVDADEVGCELCEVTPLPAEALFEDAEPPSEGD
jgi:hypothetical protein